MPYLIALQEKYLPPECTVHYPGEPWRCGTVSALYPHINRPMYVSQNMFDYNWLTGYGLPWGDYDTCTGSQFIKYVGDAMRDTAMALIVDNNGNLRKPND